MASQKFEHLLAKIEAARAHIALVRDGLVPEESDDALGLRSWRPGRGTQSERFTDRRSVDYRVPATRAYRFKTTSNASTFHFSHRAISKVTFATREEGIRNLPGAARAHGKYIEREAAVSQLNPLSEIEGRDDPNSRSIHSQEEKKHVERREWIGRGGAAGLVDNFAMAESGPPGPLAQRPVENSQSDARMWLLPRRHVVSDGWRTHGLLLGAEDVSVEARSVLHGLRQSTKSDQTSRSFAVPSLKSTADISGHDYYIGRASAVPAQPDGSRALFTNIDEDPDFRAEFWKLVEEHEGTASPDKMTFKPGDAPNFWKSVADHPDCPRELRQTIQSCWGSSVWSERSITLELVSGKRTRAFLKTFEEWLGDEDTLKSNLATFADGRGGRVQHRIVIEIPTELGPTRGFELIKEFAGGLAKRGLMVVAVMHAPDHKNNEKNWHGHIVYYDRPCRRLTQADIEAKALEGYRTDHLAEGQWDFTAITPKRNRSNGKATPFKQNKVREVSSKHWIPNLRKEYAELTNAHLERAGVDRRLDPRTYEEMGIEADPQEHLGTEQAALETRGIATPDGIENERRQWAGILAEADARLAHTLAAIDQIYASSPHENMDRLARERTVEAARLDDCAFRLEQDIARARSRASEVQRKNGQLLKAYEADPRAGSIREENLARELATSALRYLKKFDHRTADAQALPAELRTYASALLGEVRARAASNRRDDLIPLSLLRLIREESPPSKAFAPPMHRYEPALPWHAPIASADTLAMQDASRPVAPSEKIDLGVRSSEHPASADKHHDAGQIKREDKPASDAAKRAAMLAAQRGQGR